jgi:hypothetical protein
MLRRGIHLGFLAPEQEEGRQFKGQVVHGLIGVGGEDQLAVAAVEMKVAA